MRSISMQSSRSAMIAFGSSLSGRWGDPTQEIVQSIQRLAETGIVLLALSSCYRTCPLGGGRQARYWNAVGLFASAYPPYQLLRILKRIEGEAGRRRLMRRWGPRVLDLDLIDSGARVIGWARRTAGRGAKGRYAPSRPPLTPTLSPRSGGRGGRIIRNGSTRSRQRLRP